MRGVNHTMGVAYPGKWSGPGRDRTWGVPDGMEQLSAYLTGSAVIAGYAPRHSVADADARTLTTLGEVGPLLDIRWLPTMVLTVQPWNVIEDGGTQVVTVDPSGARGAAFATARTLTVTAPANGTVTGKVGAATVIDCGTDCTETVVHGTTVALKAASASGYGFESWGGDCASEASADCSVGMDADKTVSVAFLVTSVDGECDETRVDGCRRGTLNNTAYTDTDTYHQWRCDGINGGADSGRCRKAKTGCPGGNLGWSVGATACDGAVSAVGSGQSSTATDGGDPTRGSATFKCDDGAWIEQAGSTCARVCAADTIDACELSSKVRGESSGSCKAGFSGSCNYSCSDGNWDKNNNSCLMCDLPNLSCKPTAATETPVETTPAQDGDCYDTEARRCRAGRFQDQGDTTRVDGQCRYSDRRCSSGTYQYVNETAAKYVWRCRGRNAVNYWRCLGIDGANNWSCSHGGSTESCGPVSLDATDEACTELVSSGATVTCYNCKTGYEQCGDDCYQPCGENAIRNTENCECVEVHTLTVTVDPPGSGTVTGSGFNCSDQCSRDFEHDTDITLSVSPSAGYVCEFPNDRPSMIFKIVRDTDVTVSCKEPLVANAGGRYTANFSYFLGASTVTVVATASGGEPPYTFQWADRPTGPYAVYVYVTAGTKEETVIVTDSDTPPESDDDTAFIDVGLSGARSDGDGPESFEVPLGGDLYFVWGEEGSVTARSEDTAVAAVSVSSPAVRVTGVSVGETDVILQTDAGELRLPVVVR